MLNISNLDNGQQSKDGFIKSMVLFIILLAFCFAPFLAFSQSKQVSLSGNSFKKVMIKSDKYIVRMQEPRMAVTE
jgi:hypothetical protein